MHIHAQMQTSVLQLSQERVYRCDHALLLRSQKHPA